MSDTSTKTPEPVVIGSAIIAALPVILGGLVALGVVHLTPEKIGAIIAIGTALVALVGATVTRGQVTPAAVAAAPAPAALPVAAVAPVTGPPVVVNVAPAAAPAPVAVPPETAPVAAPLPEPTPVADSTPTSTPVAAPVGASPVGPVTATPDVGDEHAPVLEVPIDVPADDPALAPVVDPANDALPSQLTPDELAHATQRSISGGAA